MARRCARWVACLATALVFSLGDSVVLRAAESPTAWVVEHQDGRRRGPLADALKKAGFRVESLDLDEPLPEFDGLLAFGSWSSTCPGYPAWSTSHADAIRAFVEQGGVVLQLAQADQHEKSPPFLPRGMKARRTDRDCMTLRALRPEHPLLDGVELVDRYLKLNEKRSGWEMFEPTPDFGPLLVSTDQKRDRALMEGAFGKGRILLAGLALEVQDPGEGKTLCEPEVRKRFFRNLRDYVLSVREGTAPEVVVYPRLVEEVPFTEGSWTLALLPDTQYYASGYTRIFHEQVDWLVRERERLNLKMVLTLGDITDNNSEEQWSRASAALGKLDGVVPYLLVIGNHDSGPGGNAKTRDTRLNDFFPFETYASQPTFGGAKDTGRCENAFHTFEAGGRKWLVLALEWAPQDETLAWANDVFREHRDHVGVVAMHWFLNPSGTRSDLRKQGWPYSTPGRKNCPESIWENLIRRHDIRLVLSGHVAGDGTDHLESRTARGHTCHQMVSNYQFGPEGGGGWLRLLEFLPDSDEVVVRTYSPHYDRWLLEPEHQFRLTLD